jgi:hypothetical protein
MLLNFPPRLTERRLADIGVIRMPTSLKNSSYDGYRDDQMGRLTFNFSSTYFWASLGSITAYKQLMIVSLMAPDATDAEYSALPRRLPLSYDTRKPVRTMTIGSGTLRIVEGVYTTANLNQPSYEYLYVDRTRRLQLAWHAVKKEVDLSTGIDLVARIAASFKIVRDPAMIFTAMRDAPRKEAEAQAERVTRARTMLIREGLGPLTPGTPVLRDGIYVEWTADPEPRYQLLMPLGKVSIPANAGPAGRPRPKSGAPQDQWVGTIGWYEFVDGAWEFSNRDNDYLPLPGISARLAAERRDTSMVYFYYSATIRVELESRDERLVSTAWFRKQLPEVQQQWRAGTLVAPGRVVPWR